MNKWEKARYLIDSKKIIDNIEFIEKNINLLTNLDMREKIENKLQTFYINLRTIYDHSLSNQERKILAKTDSIYIQTRYETDKRFAHKDDDYQKPQIESLNSLITTLKSQLEHCLKICCNSLPEELTLNYVPYDKELFRHINNITPDKEEKYKNFLFPNRNEFTKQPGTTKNIFYNTEDIKDIDNKKRICCYL